jgi:S1-C subfamily serine protease
MNRSRTLLAGLVAAALAGAGIAIGVVAAFGGLSRGSTEAVAPVVTTMVRDVSAPANGTRGLTVHDIYQRDAPGVVQVTSTSIVHTTQSDPFFGPFAVPQAQTEQALGSGFVIDKAGHIVTNYHVVQGAKTVRVSFSDNESVPAKIVGVDPSSDVAVLQVGAHARALKPLVLGNSDAVQVGDPVVAIGNPFGLDRSITAGIVSALQRPITAPNGFTIDHVIQTDAALNHGNSGGPLLNARGEVIGVNSQIQTSGTSDGNVGIGFAIPINTVREVAAQIMRSGKVEHPFLGIEGKPVTPQVAKLFHLPARSGVLVAKVCAGSGAAKAGLKAASQSVTVAGESWPLGGDLITKVDGARVASTDDLRSAIETRKPGSTVSLSLFRDTKQLNVNVKLGSQPTAPSC